MNIHMTDIMLHIDEELNDREQALLETRMRSQQGVVGLGYHASKPHLMIVEYNQDMTTPKALLHSVKDFGLHAELIGLL